jgi:hypothetical protein
LLRNTNIPVIYRCSIPVAYLSGYDILDLFKEMLSRYFIKLSCPGISFDYNYSFEITKKHLENKFVKGHTIVTRKIYDPQDKGYYQFSDNQNTYGDLHF